MRVAHHPRLDLAAGLLLLSGLAVALAVFSRDPADAAAPVVQPFQAAPANLLGAPGAWLAGLLHQHLGVGVYCVLAAWFVLVLLLLVRRNVFAWLVRFSGWLLLIPSLALTAERFPQLGAGGELGVRLARELDTVLAPSSAWLVHGSFLLAALLLACDVLILHGGVLVGRAARSFLGLLGNAGSLLSWLPRLRRTPAKAPFTPIVRKPAPPTSSPAPAAPTAADAGIPIHHSTLALTPAPAAQLDPTFRLTNGVVVEERFADYELPPLTLLEDPEPDAHQETEEVLRERAALLEKTFADFGLSVRVVGIHTGPVITQYELALETGLRVNKVTVLSDDLALNLKVPSVRIVAPIPGKNTVGIEVPNEHRAKVRLKEVMLASAQGRVAKQKLPLFLGKDTEGKPLVYDLAEMPHLLIAGRTGTGKSVCMNDLIISLLMTRRPDEVKMIMIDPKMLEMIEYSKIPHLMHPVVKDMKKAEAILAWAVDKMEERYDILSRARVRNVASYNELSYEEILKRVQPVDEEDQKRIPPRMPYIVIFIDEMADLMMMMKKEVESHIIRLAQKSRAAGIHLVVATQKPTVDVITGLIKSNLPARVCFQVSSRTDSMVVIDEKGADKLLGKGDMLFLVPGTSTLLRAQGAYLSDQEIERVVDHMECEPAFAEELVGLNLSGKDGGSFLESLRARDELYEQAIEITVREGRGSTSLLQRAMGIGYGRAARLIDFMAEDGIVGAYNGSQAREVNYKPEQWEQLKNGGKLAQSA